MTERYLKLLSIVATAQMQESCGIMLLAGVRLLSCTPLCSNSSSVCLHDCQHTMTQDSIWPKYDFACFNLRERTNLILTDTFAALLEFDLLMCNGLLPCFCEGACHNGCGQKHKLTNQA